MHERLFGRSGPQLALVEIVAHFNNIGIAEMEKSYYGKALQSFHKALSKAGGSAAAELWNPLLCGYSPKSGDFTSAKNSYLYQRGSYDEGMHVYTQPIRIEHKLANPLTFQDVLIRVLYNKGLAHLELAEDERASEAFFHALSLCRWRSDVKAMSTIAILHNIGYIQYRASCHEEAMHTFEEALQLGRQVYGSHSLEVAATMNCLGALYFHMPNPATEEALDLYQQCLVIRKAILGVQHKDVATTLNNIGRVNYIKAEYEEALSNYSEALSIRRVVLGESHLDVAATIYNAGQTYHQIGDLTRAMQLYQDFITIALPQLGNKHRDIAIIYKCMAQIFQEKLSLIHI